jgi:hypothetical protein
VGSCASTWYRTNAHFSLVRELTDATVSSHFLLCACGSPPSPSLPRQPAVGAARIQGRSTAIKRHDSSDSDIEGGARGRTSIRRRFRRKGHRSFRTLRARGWAPSETPYRANSTVHSLASDFGIAAACRPAVEECVGTGVSGAKSARPARNQPMEAARRRQFELVLQLRLDRSGPQCLSVDLPPISNVLEQSELARPPGPPLSANPTLRPRCACFRVGDDSDAMSYMAGVLQLEYD